MEKRFRALRAISAIYKILAVIGALATVIAVVITIVSYLGVFSESGIPLRIYPAEILPLAALSAGILIGGWLGALTLYAMGSFIDLFLATEENTRLTAALLNRVSKQLQGGGRPAARGSAAAGAASAARAADTTIDDFDLGAI
jgi:hypothetical protein